MILLIKQENIVRARLYMTMCVLAYLLPIQSYAASYADPQFSDYPTQVYKGDLVVPAFLKEDGEVWRDDMGKTVFPLAVNTAGKFYMTPHSCGTSCRYYTLNDLSNGKESRALDRFSNDGSAPRKSKDGRDIVIDLTTRPDSALILARYYLGGLDGSSDCSASYFLLVPSGKSIKPIADSLKCPKD
jgi:hypothetical protein